jgi:ABC-type antimicrobial peptide transport system permease subunit
MGIRLEAGRTFGEAFSADSATAVVINQTLAQQQGWTDPIGQQLRMGDRAFSVIGVVEDFLLHPVAGKAQPVVFGLSDVAQYSFLTVRVENGATDQVAASLKAIWEREFPEVSFAHFSQAEVFQEFDFIINLSLQVSRSLGLFALFISCMGLFGMASQRAAQRIKEVGIRKAMGASATQVVFLVNRGFLTMLGLATLIATPLCYVGLSTLLSFAPMDIPLGIAPLILSNVLVFLLAAVSLSMQSYKLVKVIPAEVLRYD